MIPLKLRAKWDRDIDRREVIFMANNGGGYPEALAAPELDPEERLCVLRGLGFRVAEQYDIPCNFDRQPVQMERWARLTNDVAVNLENGFVLRTDRKGKWSHG